MKRIININTPEIPSPGNFKFTADKFLQGFKQNNIEVYEINNLYDIEQYNTEDTYFFLSNHFVSLGNTNYLYDIGQKLLNPVFICFHFNFEKEIRENMPFKKYIITGEYYRTKPASSKEHIDAFNFANECNNWLPLEFASSADPNHIGKLFRKDIYDSMFIGAPYRTHILDKLNQDGYKNYFKYGYGNYISEQERINIFLSSRVCLGFHGDGNIQNACVTERVFEGLSYGCVVVTDNPYAEIATNGIVQYVDNYYDLLSIIDRCKLDDDYFYNKQKLGYEYIRYNGLYYHEAIKFMKKTQQLYGNNYDF